MYDADLYPVWNLPGLSEFIDLPLESCCARFILFNEQEYYLPSLLKTSEVLMLQEGSQGNDRRALFSSAIPPWTGKTINEDDASVVPGHDWKPSGKITTENEVFDLRVWLDRPVGGRWYSH